MGLFHMVFNRAVENFHIAFTFCDEPVGGLALKLLSAANSGPAIRHQDSSQFFRPVPRGNFAEGLFNLLRPFRFPLRDSIP